MPDSGYFTDQNSPAKLFEYSNENFLIAIMARSPKTMADKNGNKNFIKGDPGMGVGAIIWLIVAAIAIFGGLAYILIVHGDKLAVR